MRSAFFGIALSAALVGACATHQNSQEGDVNHCKTGDCGSGAGGGSGSGSGSSSASCPLGAGNFSEVIAAGDLVAMSLAVDAQGNVFVAANNSVSEISAAGRLGDISLPEGSLLAMDAEGNLFVAGSFSAAFDIGSFHLVPTGNVNVFIAKLDAKGKVIFAKALDECGSGISAMVIGKDGRIAISGAAMGTIVLSARGEVLFTIAMSGNIAFDAKGDLVIAGSVNPNAGLNNVAFVAMFDANGKQIFDQQITAQAESFVFTAVAFDAMGNLVLAGETNGTVDLFGTKIVAKVNAQVDVTSGAFLAVVNVAGGNCVAQRVIDLGIVSANAIVIAANGDIFVAGASFAANLSLRAVALLKVDANDRIVAIDLAGLEGEAIATAIDACGSLLLGVNERTTDLQAAVLKLTLK